jgi:hypothetical protein
LARRVASRGKTRLLHKGFGKGIAIIKRKAGRRRACPRSEKKERYKSQTPEETGRDRKRPEDRDKMFAIVNVLLTK